MMTGLYRLMIKNIPVAYCTEQNRPYYGSRRMMLFTLEDDVWKITEKELKLKEKIIREQLSLMRPHPAYVTGAFFKVFDIEAILERVSDLMKEVSLQLAMVGDLRLLKGNQMDISVRLKQFAVDREIPVLASITLPDPYPLTLQKICAWLGGTAIYTNSMLLLKRKNYPFKGKNRFYNTSTGYRHGYDW